MQEGWSEQQFIGLAFSSCSGGLAITHLIRTVGWDYLVAIGYKVALEILCHEQSLSEEAFPRRNLGRDGGSAWL